MADPLHHPTLLTKMRATLAGERDTVLLEALRGAGRAAFDELMAAEKLRDELTAGGTTVWDAPAAVASQLLAAWNAFVLQSLGEAFLDADYAANPGTVGYVPPVTFQQVSGWLSAVEGWISRARQARVNPDYDISTELALPAGLPAWVEVEPCPAEHLAALLAAIPPVREHIDVALFALERRDVPARHQQAVNRLKQLAAEAAAAADYAVSLSTQRHHPGLHELIENNLKNALELWFHVGQLAAMPRLLDNYRALRPAARPDVAALPGGSRFDPWCLTDRATLARWQRDPQARQAIAEMWQYDPDPAATLTLKAQIDAAVAAGDVVLHRTRAGSTCYYECPWSPLYEVRRPTRIAGRSLKVLEQFTLQAAADDVLRGGTFERGIVTGPFQPTNEVDYCDPDGLH
ncbi:hypothetical protein DMB66_51295 [Actinoplanes sp. ATCC 53533]|uniref:hypothetical protein n=1 Tax=Actinoplanes sp. ATCC 53533 TaxID=1288362 RepID=UPI000F77DD88|nr:hypothetical protein [Actinoplanes sp. ATCC 53533]RSM45302.1 hypothetical protein DMB66_51295 [Actinoplanes sp. ATCC 53533]